MVTLVLKGCVVGSLRGLATLGLIAVTYHIRRLIRTASIIQYLDSINRAAINNTNKVKFGQQFDSFNNYQIKVQGKLTKVPNTDSTYSICSSPF